MGRDRKRKMIQPTVGTVLSMHDLFKSIQLCELKKTWSSEVESTITTIKLAHSHNYKKKNFHLPIWVSMKYNQERDPKIN